MEPCKLTRAEKIGVLRELANVLDTLPALPAAAGSKPEAKPKPRSAALLAQVAREEAAVEQGQQQQQQYQHQRECPVGFRQGQQLLPRTATLYRAPWAELQLLADALSFGWLGPAALSFLAVREVRLVLGRAAPGRGPVLFRPLLPPRPCTAAAFEGSAWPLAQAHRRLLGVLGILLLINLGAWTISLITVGLGSADRNPLNALWAWQFQALTDFSGSVLHGAPSLLALSGWSLLAAILAGVFFAAHVMGKTSLTRLLGADVGSVLSVALLPRAPLAMVSYPWLPSQLAIARSLASCLPGAWVDVQMLTPGCNVAAITSGTSHWAFCLVLVISADYLSRDACALEFVTAALNRSADYQHTVAYAAAEGGEAGVPALPPAALDLLRRLGISVFEGPEELLQHLHAHVYTCSTASDRARVTAWYGRVSDARSDVPRGLRLPFPSLRASASGAAAGAAVAAGEAAGAVAAAAAPPSGPWRLLPPPLAVCAGRFYLSADGQHLGLHAALSLEQLAIAACVAFLALAAGFHAGAYLQLQPGATMAPGTAYGMPLVALAVLGMIVVSSLPLQVDLDARNYHSDVLLNLSVAAWFNHLQPSSAAGEKQRRSLGAFSWSSSGGSGGGGGSSSGGGSGRSSSSSAGGGPAEEIHPLLRFSVTIFVPAAAASIPPGTRLHVALRNTADFLCRLGLDTAQVALDGGSGEQGARQGSTIFVFVLLAAEDREAWRERWRGRVSEDRAVLVVSQALMEAEGSSDLRGHMLIVLQQCQATGEYSLSVNSAYAGEGFVVCLLDALGAKVGPAFLERERAAREGRS